MKHTRVPRTVRRDLAASYRNIVDTKPSRFLKPNPELGWKSNRKPKKTEWTKPIEKPKRRKQKNPHTFPTLKYLNLGRLMRCNVCEKYEPFCKKKKKWPQKFNLFHTLLQAKHVNFWDANFVPTSISPTLYGLLYSAMFLHQRTNVTGTHTTITVKKKNVDVLSMMMTCNGRYYEDEVRPANYIKFN